MPESAVKSPAVYPLPDDPEPSAAPDSQFPPDIKFKDRVEVLLRFGGPHLALQALQELLSANPESEDRARHYLKAGQIRERMGNLEAARACYEEAVALEPQREEIAYFAHNNLAYCLNRDGRYLEAERTARLARDIAPERVNAHKNLGIALEGLGQIPDAAESLLAAVRIEPDHPVAMRRLRVLLASHPVIGHDRLELAREVEDLVARGRRDGPASKAIPDDDLEGALRRLLESIRVDDALVDRGFQVFGLRWDAGDGPRYLTLDEAMAKKGLEVREINEAGSVPRIRVINHAKDRVFLMAGEQLVGAKQNRVLNASILLDARSDLPIPVSCVEAGRWSYRGPRFESKGSSSHYALRHMMSKKSYEFYRMCGTPESDQGEVWQEVSRKLVEHQTASPSRALDDVYEKLDQRLDEATERLKPRAHWCGAVFCHAGRIVGVDLFDRPETLQKQWPKLARGYALDVLGRKGAAEVPRNRVEEWLRGSAQSLIDMFPSPGLGIDCRLESNHHVGAVLVVDGHPVHLEMFYEEEM